MICKICKLNSEKMITVRSEKKLIFIYVKNVILNFFT